MNTVNWWLMALAFVLGLLLTFVTVIRRVKREAPIQRAAALAGASGGTAAGTPATRGTARLDGGAPAGYPIEANEDATAETPAAEDDSTNQSASAGTVGAAGAAGTAAAGTASRFAGTTSEDRPYGVGSVRVDAGTSAPQGYTVKGNENSMLYHTPASPSYTQTIAEVWFKDEESAVHAGFTPWHKGRKAR